MSTPIDDAAAGPAQAGVIDPSVSEAGEVPAPPEPTRAMRRTRGILITVGCILLLAIAVGVGVFVHLSAHAAYDEARDATESSIQEAAAARDGLAASARNRAEVVEGAEDVVAVAPADLIDPATLAALGEQATAGEAAVKQAQATIDSWEAPALAEKPIWTWELTADTTVLKQDEQEAASFEDSADTAEAALDVADTAVTDAAAALFASAPAVAATVEQANVSATTGAVLDFRDAAQAVAAQASPSADAAAALTAYAERAAALRASQAAELAEKAGPQLDTRLEIEAYARSISGGVLLDFDWASTAAGAGGPNSIGGTATWDSSRGGFSTVTLSYSVADWWPGDDARALVTHEVGHSITAKCYQLFDSQSGPANEEWATAWAISMGQTAEGNGVQAYGYPSQAMIDAASGCR
ncbi:hypothetical protein ABC304_12075 [Microbacterium sp. 1P10UB]|uniref:hypothetical protein n=1 Tax=unclassified Microbacterium TaxID=2609290 RepID=UPI0039A29B9F